MIILGLFHVLLSRPPVTVTVTAMTALSRWATVNPSGIIDSAAPIPSAHRDKVTVPQAPFDSKSLSYKITKI
jgi:hypothetical protein